MKKKFLAIICFLYCIIISYVWLSGNINNFIAPNMQFFIKSSLILLLIMGIVLLMNNRINYKFKYSDLLLLIPFILVILADDGNLSIAIAKVKKISKAETKLYDVEYDIINDSDSDTDLQVIDDFYFDIDDSIYSYLADYLTYTAGAHKFVGKTIRFKGFAVDYSDYLSSDYFALGKYSISCCAADAEFTGFIVKYPPSSIKLGNWYQVTGILELGKDNEGYTVMTVNPVSVEEISKKDENEYVYSCDTYGKNACLKISEYDLEY